MSAAPIVAFGEDWGRHPSSTQHLMAHLSRERRILYCESVGLRRPRLADAGRAAEKLRAAFAGARGPQGGARQAGEGAGGDAARPEAVLSPPAAPFPGARLARAANRALWRRSVGRRAAAMGLERPILWTSLPTALDARDAVAHRALVYYCGDEFGALDGVDHGPVLALERELAAAADLIVVSHPALAAKFDPARTRLLPHGVDLARFEGLDGPDRRAAPVAGFLGRLDDRLDYAAIEAAARALPDWRFALVGPVAPSGAEGVRRLAALANVEVPGPASPAAVPALLAGWTAALLPYRDTPMTRACDPLKLREYLAAGTPVAGFDIPGVRAHSPAVTLATPESLPAALRAAAGEPESARAARRASVAADDWRARAATLSSWLERFE